MKLKKLNKSEIFEDLNLLSNLLRKPNKKDQKIKKIKKSPLIEVIKSENNEDAQDVESLEEEKSYPNDEYKYGFNDQFSDFFEELTVIYHCF